MTTTVELDVVAPVALEVLRELHAAADRTGVRITDLARVLRQRKVLPAMHPVDLSWIVRTALAGSRGESWTWAKADGWPMCRWRLCPLVDRRPDLPGGGW